MTTIYIQTLPTEKIAVVEKNSQLIEIAMDRPGYVTLVGNIYMGKVIKIERGMQAAFVDIGTDKPAFLKDSEIPEGNKEPLRRIESLITEGQSLIVQVKKDAYGSKGAVVTANITVPGTSIIYLPFGQYVAVSKRLSEQERQRLKQQFDRILKEDEGAIIRTSAAQVSSFHIIQAEYEQLRKRWLEWTSNLAKLKVPSCIYSESMIPERFLRQYAAHSIDAVYMDSASEANWVRTMIPALAGKVHWQQDIEARLPKSINQLLGEVAATTISLSGGIELVVEQTEALCVIDVNSGGYTGKMNKEDTVLRVNLQAATAIAVQLRLRNLSGIIVIDFIGMKSQANQEKVIRALKQALADDPVRTEIYGFTKLGLLEMTRKRESYPLPYLLQAGNNELKRQVFSPVTRAFMLERELLQYRQRNHESILIDIHPTVFKAWSDNQISDQLKTLLPQDVYVRRTKSVHTYQIKLAGSNKLINDYINEKRLDSIDKLF